MDSRYVNRFIKNEIWPALSERGFETAKPRVAWREHTDRIDTIVFRAFSAYDMSLFALRPGSFWIEQSCHLKYITNPMADETGVATSLRRPMPEECLLRCSLERKFKGPKGMGSEIWPIGFPDQPPQKVMDEARRTVLGEGVAWFEQFASPAAVYEILDSREEDMKNLWGFGRRGSPLRVYMLAYAAIAAGKKKVAREFLEETIQKGHFPGHQARMRADAGLP